MTTDKCPKCGNGVIQQDLPIAFNLEPDPPLVMAQPTPDEALTVGISRAVTVATKRCMGCRSRWYEDPNNDYAIAFVREER